MPVSKWMCVRARAGVHFVCLCVFSVCNVQNACFHLCVRRSNACRYLSQFSLFVCVWRSVLRPVVGHPARCVLFFICDVHVRSPHVGCVCVRLISLSVYSACIGTSACDLARWRGDWLVFMNKRHNCDRMIYDLHIPQSPPSFLLSFSFC